MRVFQKYFLTPKFGIWIKYFYHNICHLKIDGKVKHSHTLIFKYTCDFCLRIWSILTLSMYVNIQQSMHGTGLRCWMRLSNWSIPFISNLTNCACRYIFFYFFARSLIFMLIWFTFLFCSLAQIFHPLQHGSLHCR